MLATVYITVMPCHLVVQQARFERIYCLGLQVIAKWAKLGFSEKVVGRTTHDNPTYHAQNSNFKLPNDSERQFVRDTADGSFNKTNS